MSDSEDKVKFRGVVTSAAGNGRFVVQTDKGHAVKCVLSGKMRINNVMVVEGDSVDVEVSVYDLSNGRIVYRLKKGQNEQTK